MKKILCLLLITSLVFPVLTIPSKAEDEEFGKDIEIVKAIGIMQGDENGDFNPDECLTRAEFAKIVCSLTGIQVEVESLNSTGFEDLSESHWAYKYIYLVVNSGYMHGGNDRKFRPDDCITGTEAAKVLIHLLGYEYQANAAGGYPDGYEAEATKLGLFDGLIFNKRDFILRKEIAKLINNALDVNIVEFSSVVNDEYEYQVSTTDTLLSYNLDMRKGYGLVTSTDTASVKGYPVSNNGRIIIDDISCYYSDADDLLGKKCEFIYSFDEKDSSNNKIVYISPVNYKELIINRDDYLDFKDNRLIYKSKDSKTSEVKIPQTADYILNGSNVQFSNDIFNNIMLGTITLIASDSVTYDIVKIKDYKIIYSGDVNSYTNRVCDINDNRDYFSFEDQLKKYRIYNAKGEPATIEKISSGMLLTVAEGADITEVVITEDVISGTVDYLSLSDKEIGIGGEVYKLDYYALKYYSKIKPGTYVDGYKNALGYISVIKESGEKEGALGYLVKVADNPSPVSYNLRAKIFMTDGSFLSAGFAEKTLINGKLIKNINKTGFLNELGLGNDYNTVVKVTVSENGEITSLDTSRTPAQIEASGKDGICSMYPLANRYHMQESTNFDFEAYYDNNTVFMQLPSDPQNADDSEFHIVKQNAFQGSTRYNVEGYTNSIDDVVSSLIITRENVYGTLSNYNVMAVVSKAARIFDSEKGEAIKLSLYAGRYGSSSTEFELVSYLADNLNDANSYKVTDLVAGDVIKVLYDDAYKLQNFSIYYKFDENKWLSTQAEDKTAINRVFMREVDSFKKGFVKLIELNNPSNYEFHDLNSLVIIVVRKVGNKAVVRLGLPSDVNIYDKCIIQTISKRALSLTIFK